MLTSTILEVQELNFLDFLDCVVLHVDILIPNCFAKMKIYLPFPKFKLWIVSMHF